MLIGTVLIYIPGLLWLKQFTPDWATTINLGLEPFIVGDSIKLFFAASLLPSVWSLVGKTNQNK
jgi:biotin transport system substrate-specific component